MEHFGNLKAIVVNGEKPTVQLHVIAYGTKAADALLDMAFHHKDPQVRIAAAESLVRLALENPIVGDLPGSKLFAGFLSKPESGDGS